MSETLESSVRSRRKKEWGGMTPKRAMAISPLSVRLHPPRSTGSDPGLYNSIHSSLAEASVPAQATSLISTTAALGAGEDVGTQVPHGVGVRLSGIAVGEG